MHSTLIKAVTNGRATGDDTRRSGTNGLIIGLSGMLHFAVGIWPSRDNVWTNSSQSGCGRAGLCTEPMVETQTLLAVLSGGPYGPSDKADTTNASLVMRSCRSDGVLLRADKPITALDVAFQHSFSAPGSINNVWSTHSAAGGYRFAYVLALNLEAPFPVSVADVWPEAPQGQRYIAYEYWFGVERNQFTAVDASSPYNVAACPPPADRRAMCSGYYIFAPVLPSEWVYLGEPGKIVVASAHRVAAMSGTVASHTQSATLVGAPGEVITAAFLSPNSVQQLFLNARQGGGGVTPVHVACTVPQCGQGDCSVQVQCSGTTCRC